MKTVIAVDPVNGMVKHYCCGAIIDTDTHAGDIDIGNRDVPGIRRHRGGNENLISRLHHFVRYFPVIFRRAAR